MNIPNKNILFQFFLRDGESVRTVNNLFETHEVKIDLISIYVTTWWKKLIATSPKYRVAMQLQFKGVLKKINAVFKEKRLVFFRINISLK